MDIRTNKTTGFEALNPVTIYDRKGFIFYATETPCFFNLPENFTGKVDGEIRQLKNPVVYETPDLPTFEKKTPLKRLTITYGENPNKCSIRFKDGVIFFDNEFKDKELTRNYIIGHEIGHFFYIGNGDESEMKCDIFSAKMMLDNGYNPSQILLTSFLTLTGENKDIRVNGLKEYLQKVEIKKSIKK